MKTCLHAATVAAALLVAGSAGAQPQGASDPRVGLRAGVHDAGFAAWGLELVGHVAKPEGFYNPEDPGDFSMMNSDMAFQGNTLYLGNFHGLQVYDISDPTSPRLVATVECPGGQNDVSVHGDLLFMSVEETRGRLDCGPEGVQAPASPERFRGVRIYDVRDVDHPRQVAAVQTCRGSHTHTLVPDPNDDSHVYLYVSGTSGVRPTEELAGCSSADADDPASSRFRIEVIEVPLDNPAGAAIVNAPAFLRGLEGVPVHGATPEMVAAAAAVAAEARARGEFTFTNDGLEMVLPSVISRQLLDQIVAGRGGTGEPTAADSTTLRTALPAMAAQQEAAQEGPATGPDQCHDITVYNAVGLAAGACGGYGILLDISDPANPVRIDAAADSNFAYWHSATFSDDGTAVVFTDEWGGGMAPRCRAMDRPEWGANALFSIDNRQLTFRSYYKLPAAQTESENCVAHNGSLVPIAGRDIMVQGWYQGGTSVFDFTDPANPVEIAYFDRGPLNAEELGMAGHWGAYWYNGHVYASEIGRGLDVFRLVPTEHLSAAEIAAAEGIQVEAFNPQTQERIAWGE